MTTAKPTPLEGLEQAVRQLKFENKDLRRRNKEILGVLELLVDGLVNEENWDDVLLKDGIALLEKLSSQTKV